MDVVVETVLDAALDVRLVNDHLLGWFVCDG